MHLVTYSCSRLKDIASKTISKKKYNEHSLKISRQIKSKTQSYEITAGFYPSKELYLVIFVIWGDTNHFIDASFRYGHFFLLQIEGHSQQSCSEQ